MARTTFAQSLGGELSLPEVRVLGTTPLSTIRTPRQSNNSGGSERLSPPRTASPAPAAPVVESGQDVGASNAVTHPEPTTMTPQDFDHAISTSVPDALLRRVPGVMLSDPSGNSFQPDVQYRGFAASPVIGTPQGLAIYQNGVRLNEAFGDTVNWDLIPETAINRLDVVSNNPVFGLNAIGGAISIEMKSGFTYEGREAELRGGSFGRRAAGAQAGFRQGNVSAYFAADALIDNGWRVRSPSQLRRFYGDVGVRNDNSEFHLNFTGASNAFGAAASTPIEMLNRSWSAVYTTPQTYRNQLAFLNTTGSYELSDAVVVKGNAYVRNFRQSHVDGNTSDVQACDSALAPGFLCFGNDTTPLVGTGGPVPDILNGAVPGVIDRTSTAATTFGGSLQTTAGGKFYGHDNHFVIGASFDRGASNFNAWSELGTIPSDLFVTGTGVIISQPAGDVTPVALSTLSSYSGFYLTDTFDVTSRFSLTAGGRLNVAQVKLADQVGMALNGDYQFTRFNPVVGATHKINSNLTAYAGYSESNRAPTPAELACADPARPCLLDNFLVADPPLKQVVGQTYEAGIRGSTGSRARQARIDWSFGLFRTDSHDDIINVASPITGHGFFQNAGTTRRQGLEASASYRSDRWNVFTTYSHVDATFRDALLLSSPHNPFAADGRIAVTPGNRIPSIPAHRFKAGVEHALLENWKLGASLVAAGGQFLRGDESNLNPMLPGYWVVNLHSSYQISKHVEVFGLVQNLFNRHYFTFGTFFDPTAIPFLGLADPRTLSPGAPLAAYGGLRGRF